MVIDSHHHFWNYTDEDYGWIDDSMSPVRRDFLPSDLKEAIQIAGVDGVISVQARQSLEETDWLLKMSEENDFIMGVTGWLPLVDNDIENLIGRYVSHEKFKAVRHVIHDEEDDNFILRKDFNRGVSKLFKHDLVYEILIFEKHLPQTISFVDQHPEQVFVLDHIGKPRIKENVLSPWRENMAELAKRENVFCKMSGMVTEADFKLWTPAQLQPYADVILDSFGAERVMFGSDWPVCLVASEYDQWLNTVKDFIKQLSKNEQELILGGNARRVYGV